MATLYMHIFHIRDFPVHYSPSGGIGMVYHEHLEMLHIIFLHLKMGKLMIQGVYVCVHVCVCVCVHVCVHVCVCLCCHYVHV